MAEEWREVRLGDLVAEGKLMISDGYRVRNVELGPEGIPFVRGGDIGDGWINAETEDHIKPEFVDRVQAKLAGPGDVAFITKGTVGRAGRLRQGQPEVVFAPQVAYWRSLDTDALDPRFLFYLVRSPAFQAALYGVKSHGAMVADYVSISQQLDFRLSIPRIETQRAIAHTLGTLDDKIELNRRMSETLEAMARALFKSWFVDFEPVRAKAEGRDTGLPQALADLFPSSLEETEIGEIPKGWALRRVGEVANAIKGRSYKSAELSESATALVTLKSFARGGGYRADGLKPFTGTFKPEQAVQPGEIVVACTDVTQAAEVIGRPAIVQSDERFETLVASLDTVIVRPISSRVPASILYFLMRTGGFADHTFAHTTGTTVLHLAKEAIPSFTFSCPPQPLLEAFDSLGSGALRRIQLGSRNSTALSNLRNSLLPRLISGDLAVDRDRDLKGQGGS